MFARGVDGNPGNSARVDSDWTRTEQNPPSKVKRGKRKKKGKGKREEEDETPR
jgi:hypothetical protein